VRTLSALYDLLLEARARRYASGRSPSERLPRPTVSVGNVTVGGTGKTPFVLHLAERLVAEGKRPAILSRGYGRRSREVVVVSTGGGPLVSPAEGGDEPVLLARRVAGSIVVVAPRRADAARKALEFSPDVFVLDDGFQHLSVARDLDLLLLDEANPRSVAYQLARLVEHIEHLPGSRSLIRRPAEARIAISLLTAVQLAEVREFMGANSEGRRANLESLLNRLTSELRLLSDTLTRQYFSQAVPARQFSVP